jgi:photosystem II stability/assembly factor-like uncharacterized protein
MKTLVNRITILVILIFTVTLAYSQSKPTRSHSIPNYLCVKFLNSSTGMITGEAGTILKTTDQGASWNSLNTDVNVDLNYTALISETDIIAIGNNGVIIKSVDGGNMWKQKESGVTLCLYSIDIIQENQYVVCGDNGTILLTTDGGETWNPVQSAATGKLASVRFYNPHSGIIVGDGGTVLKSADGGFTWNMMASSSIYGTLNSVDFTSETNITVVGEVGNNVGTLFSSNDAGQTWAPYEDLFNAGTIFYHLAFFNSNEGIIVGNNGLTLRTDNGGLSWTQNYVIPQSSDLRSVAFSDINNAIAIGQNSTQIYTTDGGITWTQTFKRNNPDASSKNISKVIKINQNYPNPFNPSTVISYSIPSNASVTLKVYDMLGKEVKTLVNGYQSSGSYNFRFDGSNLSSGIYFYVLKANMGNNNEISKTMRMILTK